MLIMYADSIFPFQMIGALQFRLLILIFFFRKKEKSSEVVNDSLGRACHFFILLFFGWIWAFIFPLLAKSFLGFLFHDNLRRERIQSRILLHITNVRKVEGKGDENLGNTVESLRSMLQWKISSASARNSPEKWSHSGRVFLLKTFASLWNLLSAGNRQETVRRNVSKNSIRMELNDKKLL